MRKKKRARAVSKTRQMGLSKSTFFAPKNETNVISLSLIFHVTDVKILCQSLDLSIISRNYF